MKGMVLDLHIVSPASQACMQGRKPHPWVYYHN